MLVSAAIRAVYLLLMFLAGLVLSNILLPERFGTISLLILNASLLSIVTGLGTDSLMLHKVSVKEWGQEMALQFTWRAIVLQVILFSLLEFGSLAIWHRTLLANEHLSFLLLEVVYFAGLLLTEKFLALLYAFDHSFYTNIILTLVAAGYFGTLFLLSALSKNSYQAVIGLFAGQSLFQGLALLLFFYLRFKTSEVVKLSKKQFTRFLKVSSIVMLTNVVQLLAYRLDFWMIQYYSGKYEVGLYAQANKFANLCWIVPNIFAQLLLPKFAGFNKKQTQAIFGTAFYFNLLILFFTVFCAHLLYAFYLNSEYSKGLTAFHLMLPGYFFWAGVIYFAAFISGCGKFSYNLIGSSVCLVLIFLADLILIPAYGINGAAIANSICYTVVFFIYLLVLKCKFSFKVKTLFWPQKRVFNSVIKLVSR